MGKELFGYCGLYCGGCRVFQASEEGAPLNYEDGSPMICEGCRSTGTVAVWCDRQCAIKNCCREKGHDNCLACAENPCDKMTGFMQDPAYPYHLEVQANMQRLSEVGAEQWEQEMQSRYHCKQCKKRFNWFEQSCVHCGSELA